MTKNEDALLSSHRDAQSTHRYALMDEKNSRLAALLNVNNSNIKVQIDRGADVNRICQTFRYEEQVIISLQTLSLWEEVDNNNNKVCLI